MTYNKTCVSIEDSDQPLHPHGLIRVFTDLMCLLQPLGYLKRDKREPLPYWMAVQVIAGHTGLIVGFVVCWLILNYHRLCVCYLIFFFYTY